jgi:RNA polymerase sigma-70 factor (ECF subfamily)
MEGSATQGFREPIRLSVVYINRGRTVSMEASPKVGKDVIEACKAGDRKAFEKIVLFYQKRVFNFAYRMLGNMEEAKELAQEVFVSVFLSIRELREDAKFDAWLRQILLNHCRNRWKFLKRRQYFSTDSIDDPVETEEGEMIRPISDPSDTPDIVYEKKMTQEWIQKGLLKMKEDQRELIVLRDLQGLSYDEMGRLLNIPEGTVKSKLHRARMDLRDILGRMIQ